MSQHINSSHQPTYTLNSFFPAWQTHVGGHVICMLYLLNDALKSPLELVMCGSELPEISVGLQYRHDYLVHLINCLVQPAL